MQTEEHKKLSKELKANLSQLIEKRSSWEEHWQEVADYFLPRKSDVNTQKTRGDKRNIKVFDTDGTTEYLRLGEISTDATDKYGLKIYSFP